MSKVTVVLSQGASAPTPGNVVYKNTLITLLDGAGAGQTATVDGTESPAWTAVFDDVDLSAAAGSVSAQDQDSTETAIGAPVTQSVPTTGTGGGGTTNSFTPTSSIQVTVE